MLCFSPNLLRLLSSVRSRPALALLLVLAALFSPGRLGAVPATTINSLKIWRANIPEVNRPYYNAIGIASPRAGQVCVLWAWPLSNSHVEEYNLDGVWRKSWGEFQFVAPTGIAVDEQRGDYYVSDRSSDCIWKFTSQGTLLKTFGSYGTGKGQFQNPNGVAVGSNRCVYVIDAKRCDVQIFNSEGIYLNMWKLERAPGLTLTPQAIATGPNSEVYVLGGNVPESTSKNVLVFSSEGRLLHGWNSHTSDRTSNYYPEAIAVNGIGMVLISDASTFSVQQFSSTGQYERSLTVLVAGSPFRFDTLSFYYDDYVYGSTALAVCKFRLF